MKFIETPLFTRQILDLPPDDDYAELQQDLADNSEKGDIIPTAAGFGKFDTSNQGPGNEVVSGSSTTGSRPMTKS